ncbi:MAG: ABC transporter permease [Cytophagales bacterium]|nr:MAG: ABC transporter permease [Cytophagales bacterium]
MLRSYLKIALRNLWRNRLFSTITILGLALSMSVGVWLLKMITDDLQADHFHPYMDRTVRLLTDVKTSEQTTRWATVPQPVAEQLRQMSSVEQLVQVRHGQKTNVLTAGGEMPVEVLFTEPSFFDVFGFRLEAGNAQALLQTPNGVLLNRSVVGKLFGEQNPVGQSLSFDGLGTFMVLGIIEQPKQDTHLPTEAVFSLQTALNAERRGLLPTLTGRWEEYKTTATYALLHEPEQLAGLNQSLTKLSRTVGPNADPVQLSLSAQLIDDITPWNPAIQNDSHAGMNREGIWTNVLLAIALTLLAAFNYTSLSLARSLARAREVGIRKASGAVRGQVIGQFITESVLVALLALGLSLLLTYTVRASGWMPAETTRIRFDWSILAALLVYSLLTGVVAGAVPAWLLSRFQPVQVLRNLQNIRLFRGVGLYKGLIVIQFAVTTMLMVFVVILRDAGTRANDQIAQTLPNNVVLVSLKGQPAERIQNQLAQLSQVRRISATNLLGVYPATDPCTVRVAKRPKPMLVSSAAIDANWLNVFGQQLRAGTNLPPSDNKSVVLVNEMLAKQLPGYSAQTAVGQIIRVDSVDVQIAGVVIDQPNPFIQAGPSLFRVRPDRATMLALQTEPGSAASVAVACRQLWARTLPTRTPDVTIYRDATLSELHDGLGKLNQIFGFFCGLVMLIACMGILGISAYAVEVRTREVGIRRTLGARNGQVVWTLSKSFGKLLLWAGVFGIPAGWFCGTLLRGRMGQHVDVGLPNLGLGFALVLLVALLTVLSQTVRATRINPADVLRGE